MERKGREKVVACRRVERTAIVAVVARYQGIVGERGYNGGETGCRSRCVQIFTLCTFSGSVQLSDPSDDIDPENEYDLTSQWSTMLTLRVRVGT